MSKHNSKDTGDTTQNASLEYIASLVCDPTDVGDLVKAAREHVSIGQIDIALAWYQKAEGLLPNLKSIIATERKQFYSGRKRDRCRIGLGWILGGVNDKPIIPG